MAIVTKLLGKLPLEVMTNPTTQDLRTTTARKPIPPLSPEKQLILRLAAQVARLHDSEPQALDLIAEARAYLAQLDLALEFHSKVSDLRDAVATLAQPEPEGPTDEDLLELMPQQMQDDFAFAARAMAQQAGTAAGVFRVGLNTDALEYARAALARWGTR